MPKGRLRIATCQFAESFDPLGNAEIVCRYLSAAAKRRADIVHFHEACLSGYLARKSAPALADVNWPAVRQATELVCQQARALGLWVAVGSSHPLTGPHKPTNCLYLIGPDGKVHDRYDKRFCMNTDLKVYTPGNRFVTFTINGVVCSLLICFDLRFPELYRQLKRMGVQVILQSFHNGYMDGPGIHEHIMRQTVQAHAGINGFWISANNSTGRYSRWPSVFVPPDGAIAASLKRHVAGIMVNTVGTAQEFYDPSAAFRPAAMRGILHSGRCVRDKRMDDTTSL
jgi:predicted amidohydrolase